MQARVASHEKSNERRTLITLWPLITCNVYLTRIWNKVEKGRDPYDDNALFNAIPNPTPINNPRIPTRRLEDWNELQLS